MSSSILGFRLQVRGKIDPEIDRWNDAIIHVPVCFAEEAGEPKGKPVCLVIERIRSWMQSAEMTFFSRLGDRMSCSVICQYLGVESLLR